MLDQSANSGLVPSLGLGIGLSLYPPISYLISGEEIRPDVVSSIFLSMRARAYLFVNDRVAPYISLNPKIVYRIDDSLDAEDRLRANLTLSVGIACFVPRSKASFF